MKVLFQYGFLIAFLFSTLFYNVRFSYLVFFYSVDNKTFTEAFCENKDKPELQCNGSCHLEDAQQDLEKNEGQKELRVNKEISFFLPPVCEFKAKKICLNSKVVFSFNNDYLFLKSGPDSPPPRSGFYHS